jgi:hypothetical protein
VSIRRRRLSFEGRVFHRLNPASARGFFRYRRQGSVDDPAGCALRVNRSHPAGVKRVEAIVMNLRQRQALTLIANAPRGITSALLAAHGHRLDIVTDLIAAGVVTETVERTKAGDHACCHTYQNHRGRQTGAWRELKMTERRFPPPCQLVEHPESFVIMDAGGQPLAWMLAGEIP